MERSISQELTLFRKNIENLKKKYQIKELCSDAFVLNPKKNIQKNQTTKTIDLPLLALTHGNESYGIAVLNELMYFMQSEHFDLKFTLGLALGNVDAALENKRYLEKDLNRCFGVKEAKLKEEKRAQDLEKILKQSSHLIDFHQTTKATLKSFFIFPFSKESFFFARKLHPYLPIVTHWQGSFSKDGSCTDEFVQNLGGKAISLEAGACGFDPLQVGLGLEVCLKAFSLVSSTETHLPSHDNKNTEIYTFTDTTNRTNPNNEKTLLKEGLINFMPIKKGDHLGKIGDIEIRAQHDGALLFPKYPKKEENKPKEFFRIVRRVKESEIEQLTS